MASGLHIAKQRSHRFVGWFISIVIIIVLALGAWYVYRWYTTGEEFPIPIPVSAIGPKVDESDVTAKQVDEYTVPPVQPRYISIPTLGIAKTRVMKVDVNSSGELDTPMNINDAAWYDKSATPGLGYGAVMIDAHNGGYSKNGVFAKLDTLKTGDTITVERGDGKKFTYAVVSNQTVTLDEANKSGMKQLMQSADEDKEGLSLITCAGNYVPRLQQFDHRVMVRAVQTN